MEGRVQSLSEQYDGPHPSDLCDLLEGEQFFAGFEKGLDIVTGWNSSLLPLMLNYVLLGNICKRVFFNMFIYFPQTGRIVLRGVCVLCFTPV